MPSPPPFGSAGTGETPPSGGPLAAAPFVVGDLFPRFNLIDQLFIIRALILRDLRLKYQKARIGFAMEFLHPTMVIVLHYYVFIEMQRYMPGQIPTELFLIGGFITWFTFSHTGRKRVPNRGGLESMFSPCITAMHSQIAEAAWELVLNVLLCFTLLMASKILGGNIPPPDVTMSVLVLVVAAALGFGFRLTAGTLGRRWPLIEGLTKGLLWFLFITSGIYYSSPGRQDLLGAWYNPLFHLLETERHALYPGYPTAGITMLYPIAWALGLGLLGLTLNLCLFREDER